MSSVDWHTRFLELAGYIAGWSKDPSTKVGSVIADEHHRIVSVGYNGFPSGTDDFPSKLNHRETKYMWTIHAEHNAILNATRNLKGMTLYVTGHPCSACALVIAQKRLGAVVCSYPNEMPERWRSSCAHASSILREAGVDHIWDNGFGRHYFSEV